jgi:hypothetical protein
MLKMDGNKKFVQYLSLSAGVLCACAGRAETRVEPPACYTLHPTWFKIPVTAGIIDATLKTGTGGFALRAIDGGSGTPINGAQVVLRPGTLQSDATPVSGAISTAGVAVFRDLQPGGYLLEFRYIGYQAFKTPALVRAGRVDTMIVTVYESAVCLHTTPAKAR